MLDDFLQTLDPKVKEIAESFDLGRWDFKYCYCEATEVESKEKDVYHKDEDGNCAHCHKPCAGEDTFTVYSFQQFSLLMSDDNKREALLRNVEKIKKKSPHVDPHEKVRTFHDSVTGKTLLEFQLWTKFKFPITIALFIDEFAVRNNSINAKGSAVYAIIQEFPDDIKFLDENIILLASFHSRHQAHNSIFAPLVTYLQHLFHNEPHFSYFDGKKVTSLPIKPIVCIILIDKASAGWVLGIKCFSGRNSCFTCTIEGEYDKTNKHTYFPRNGDDALLQKNRQASQHSAQSELFEGRARTSKELFLPRHWCHL